MNRLELLAAQIADTKEFKKLQIVEHEATQVGIIYLNSPKDLNALDNAMMAEIGSALGYLNGRQNVKVIVLLSKVSKAFCAGANIKEFSVGALEQYMKHDTFQGICNSFNNCVKPVICGVNGVAFGGGFELALLCDILFFKDDAKVGLPELNLGLIPGIGGTQRLPRLIGKYQAMRMILSSEPMTAPQLKSFGLEVLPSENFEQAVLKIAENIATKSLSSLITAKKAVNSAAQLPLTQGMNYERSVFFPLMMTRGANEGINAFVNKKKANFRDM